MTRRPVFVNAKVRWAVGLGLVATFAVVAAWRYALGAPPVLYVLRLYRDHGFLHEQLQALGWLARNDERHRNLFRCICARRLNSDSGLIGAGRQELRHSANGWRGWTIGRNAAARRELYGSRR